MHLIKRKGHKEKFDEKKVYASVYYACRTCQMTEQRSEKIANAVTGEITSRVAKNRIKTSKDIFHNVSEILKEHHVDAAFMYETHTDIC